MNCILCGCSEKSRVYNDVTDWEYGTYRPVSYAVCAGCNLIAQDPLPEAELIPTFYPPQYRNQLPASKNLLSKLKSLQFLHTASIVSDYIGPGNTLEIGCGNGQLLLALKEKGISKLYGSDLKDSNFQSLGEAGIVVRAANIEEEFPFQERFDAIIMNNVFEHLLKPIDVLRRCKNHLSDRGRILLIMPNSNAFELAIFKEHWAGFHAPRHIYLFNESNVNYLRDQLGFSSVVVKPTTDPGQWALSIQNMLQDTSNMQTELKNGVAWYTTPLAILLSPVAVAQNLAGQSTSMLCIFSL
jgi:SAM-dependent methyltransferase